MLKAAVSPARNEKTGRTVRLEPLDMARHSDDLWREQQPQLWDYLPDGPFTTREAFDAAFVAKQHSTEQLFWAVVDVASGSAWGCASIMSISLPNAVCEVGYVWFTKRLQQTRQATEAFFLFLRIAFEEMACRRCVWKCNAQNEPSKRAAARLGFTAEGVHRKQLIVKVSETRSRVMKSDLTVTRDAIATRRGFQCWTTSGRSTRRG